MTHTRMTSDTLSQLLADLRLARGSVHIGPVPVQAPAPGRGTPGACFFMVLDGAARVTPVADGSPFKLEAGDCVVLLDPSAWNVRVLAPAAGTAGAPRCLSGVFELHNPAAEGLLTMLPSLVQIEASAPETQGLFGLALDELRRPRPGGLAIVTRLCELVLLHALRGRLSELSAPPGGGATTLRDARIARSLALIHRAPGRPWTVAGLAREVGISRSRFADRFREAVGETPMRYLTRLRLERSRELLADVRRSVGEVAEACGYTSEDAFARAFRRLDGRTPAVWRRSWFAGRDLAASEAAA